MQDHFGAHFGGEKRKFRLTFVQNELNDDFLGESSLAKNLQMLFGGVGTLTLLQDLCSTGKEHKHTTSVIPISNTVRIGIADQSGIQITDLCPIVEWSIHIIHILDAFYILFVVLLTTPSLLL